MVYALRRFFRFFSRTRSFSFCFLFFLEFFVSFHDACHQFMAYDVFLVQFDEADAFYTLQNLDGLHESGEVCEAGRSICVISPVTIIFGCSYPLRVSNILICWVVVFWASVQNNYGIIQRTSTHEGQRGNL